MNIVILDAKTLGDVDLSALEALGNVTIYDTTKAQETLQRVKDADIVVTNKVVIDANIMKNSNIKMVAITATGMNNVDLEMAKELGIVVRNVAGYSTKSVVQHTFAMLFYLLEQLRYYDEFVKSGAWSDSGLFTNVSRSFYEVSGKKWGIIGLGEIGRGVAKIANSFGAEVLYYSTSGKNSNSEYERVELNELLKSCDIISIHAPLNDNTLNLLNKDNLELLKSGSILLNLGRGGIINENDLAKIIDSKDIFVGLDVTSSEPLPKSSPLMQIKNNHRLLITPHIAWTSIEARQELMEGVVENIREFING